MGYPRENMDLLWDLIQAAQAVGWHSARLSDEPTIEKFSDAYEAQVKALSKAYVKMEMLECGEEVRDG